MGRAISSEGLSELQKALREDDEAAVEAQMTSPNLGLGRRLTRVASINPSSPSRGRDGTGLSGFSEFSAGLEGAAMTPLASAMKPSRECTFCEPASPSAPKAGAATYDRLPISGAPPT
mgnify:CR=1 FL=1